MTIIEYASLTCSHCANFHKTTWPELKKRYIDTGKVRFVRANSPRSARRRLHARPLRRQRQVLPDHGPPLRAAAELGFHRQAAGRPAPADAAGGFSQEKFDACLKDQKLYDAVNAVKNRGMEQFRVDSARLSSSMVSVILEACRSMRLRRSSSLSWANKLHHPALTGRGGKAASMKLTRLRIAGFKTFVEPTDFLIEPGLTGVVGPNGCGKSNLVEALRWVMGENSHKNMRATGMDDVIFSGSSGSGAVRPATGPR